MPGKPASGSGPKHQSGNASSWGLGIAWSWVRKFRTAVALGIQVYKQHLSWDLKPVNLTYIGLSGSLMGLDFLQVHSRLSKDPGIPCLRLRGGFPGSFHT